MEKASQQRSDPETKLLSRAITLAARKMRSVQDLRTTLLKENFDPDEIEMALERLQEMYLLSDQKFAQAIARRYADRGNRFIVQKLKTKGVDAEQHEAAFDELATEYSRALQVGQKKMRQLVKLQAHIVRQKLYQHLAMRGFGGSINQKVVRELVEGADEDAL